jgi:predicted RNase H-like HicB family nuclease
VWSFERPSQERHVTAYVLLLFRVHQDDETGIWEGLCDELDVASCGDTYHEALEAAIEATEDYLNIIEELGERESVFKERDVVVDPSEPTSARQRELPPGDVLSAQRGFRSVHGTRLLVRPASETGTTCGVSSVHDTGRRVVQPGGPPPRDEH